MIANIFPNKSTSGWSSFSNDKEFLGGFSRWGAIQFRWFNIEMEMTGPIPVSAMLFLPFKMKLMFNS